MTTTTTTDPLDAVAARLTSHLKYHHEQNDVPDEEKTWDTEDWNEGFSSGLRYALQIVNEVKGQQQP